MYVQNITIAWYISKAISAATLNEIASVFMYKLKAETNIEFSLLSKY